MRPRLLVSMVILIFAVQPLWASDDHQGRYTLEAHDIGQSAKLQDLIDVARNQNTAIASARATWKAGLENIRIAGALPDPQASVTWFPAPIETRLGPQDWNAMLSQQIPFPKKLTAKKEIASIEVALAQLKTDEVFRKVVADVKTAFYELIYIRKAGEIAEKNMALLNQFREMAQSTYGQNRAVFAEVVKAQAQAGQVQYDRMLLQDLEETQVTVLNGLLNRPPQTPIGTLMAPEEGWELPRLELLFQTARTRREVIAMADKAIQKAQKEEKLAGYAKYPDFKLGVTWSGIGNPDVPSPPDDAGDDAFGIQFGVTIPLWYGKNKAKQLKALAMIQAKAAQKQEMVNQTQTRIRTLYYKVRNAIRQEELYKNDLLPQALRALDVSETWFREGQGPFSDILESQAAVYNFQLSLARARSDKGKYMAALEPLVGAAMSELNQKDLENADPHRTGAGSKEAAQ
ncbi:MAG: TolC family protein [Desulfobacterales bacterium]|nr:TolC family protein [Desulfobacterales bacterium]